MAIVNAQLTTTQLDILSTPTDGSVDGYAITNILVCNTDNADAANFDMHLIPNGQVLDNKVSMVIKELTLPAGETFTFDSEKIVLAPGDKIAFVARPDAGSGLTDLAATVSYLAV
jgi:hypothetical protein